MASTTIEWLTERVRANVEAIALASGIKMMASDLLIDEATGDVFAAGTYVGTISAPNLVVERGDTSLTVIRL